MDRFAELIGRQYRLFDYVGAPDADRVVVIMGSGGGDGRGGGRGPERPGREGRPAQGPALPAVLGVGLRRGPAGDASGRSPCSTGPRSRARSASRSTRTCVTALVEALGRRRRRRCPGSSAAATGCRPRSSRRRWSRPSSTSWPPSRAEAALHRRHHRRRDPPEPEVRPRLLDRARRRAPGRSSTGWAATAPSAPTRTRSRSSARTRRCTPRATSSTTRRSRARSPSRTCGSARGRSTRRT